MNDSERLAHYDRSYFTRGDPEAAPNRDGYLREDQFHAICYACGIRPGGTLTGFAEQIAYISDRGSRDDPGRVLSIGAGRCEMEQVLARFCSVPVTAIEPADAALQLREERKEGWLDPAHDIVCLNQTLMLHLAAVPCGEWPYSTVIFCESIEHIPSIELDALWPRLENCRLIIVNWKTFFPIQPHGNGWDHITAIDEALYAMICELGEVWLRDGSHLVVDIP